MRQSWCRGLAVGGLALGVFAASPAVGQIGGKTAGDGVFLLEDVEDLDLHAIGVQRDWIPQFVFNGGLSAVQLETTSLITAPGQSPTGALLYQVPGEYGFINKSFGVPMPSVPGASTLPSPGNILDFSHFEFLIAFTPAIEVQEFWVILETYPEREPNVFQHIMWKYEPIAGNTFRRVSIPIHEPTLILDGEGFTLDELLSKTRFLSFYFYAEVPLFPLTQFRAYIDDIVLIPGDIPPPPEITDVWMIYGPPATQDIPTDDTPGGDPGTGF